MFFLCTYMYYVYFKLINFVLNITSVYFLQAEEGIIIHVPSVNILKGNLIISVPSLTIFYFVYLRHVPNLYPLIILGIMNNLSPLKVNTSIRLEILTFFYTFNKVIIRFLLEMSKEPVCYLPLLFGIMLTESILYPFPSYLWK